MLNKSFILFVAVIISTAIIALAGCSSGDISTSAKGQGAISAKLIWSSSKASAKSVASAPVGVATVRLTISGPEMTTMQQDFPAANGSGTLSGVPVGNGLTVTASGLDASGALTFRGSVENIAVQNGQTTNVGIITMLPVFSFTEKVYDYNASPAGVPLSGVTATTVGLSPTSQEITTTTDVNGLYVLAGLPQNTSLSFKMSMTGYADTYIGNFYLRANSDRSENPCGLWLPSKLAGWGNVAGNGVIRSYVVNSATNQIRGYIGGAVVTVTDQADGSTYPVKYIDSSTGLISSTLTSTDPANGLYIVVNIPAGHIVNITATGSDHTFNTRTFAIHADAVSEARIVGTELPPTISGTPATSATVDSAYSFTTTATRAASFSITGSVPPGLNFDTLTGTLSGIPTTAGSYSNIIISATNSTGTTSLPAFTITVNPSPPTGITPYISDANTVLLDHFDGGTSASILAYSQTGQSCGSPLPPATPGYSYEAGPNGLSQSLMLNPPSGMPAGSAAYFQYPGGQLLSQPNGTIEFWAYLTSWDVSLIDQGPFYGSCAGWTFSMGVSATGQLQSGAWAAFNMNSGTTTIPLNSWTHIAATWGSSGAKLYINGVQVGSDANTGMPAGGYGGSLIGRLGTYSGLSATIDELRVSNIQRTTFNSNLPTGSVTAQW